MRILRTILCGICAIGASSASANEVSDFSMGYLPLHAFEDAMFNGPSALRFQSKLGRHVTVEFNFNAASGREEKSASSSIRPNRARGFGQPLSVGRASVSISATMGVRFKVKF